MAEAIEALYPGTKFAIGPAIEAGFYYDIDTPEGVTISSNDLPKIEQKMIELARQKNVYTRKDVSKADAISYFKEKGDQYKLELIDGLEDGSITFYNQGNFTDLCRGPHIPHTGTIKAVKLTKVAGAYWRGDETREQLTRIYGITFPKAKELGEYLAMIEEAKKRDHRKLGAELELFMFSEKVGAGLPIWLPKGTALRTRLENFLKEEQVKRGYTPVITPHIAKKELYITSGHYEKYGADSFQPINTPREGEEFLLKPMNCPHHCEIYGHKPRSYKELPVRIAEFGTVYRYEQSGELHGLTRVRGFTQDDAIGSDENWNKAEQAIIEATQEVGLETITELGEAAFYGPKLDFMVKDALGRSWQLGTIQVDYTLPDRFELEYIGADNKAHRPIMIHRAPFGSMERFIGVLIEHCAGKFPLWLAPEQYAVLTLNDQLNDHGKQIVNNLSAMDVRGFVDGRSESIGRKIRDAEIKKIPFMLILGEKEAAAGKVSVRKQGEGDLGLMSLEQFAELIQQES